MKKLTLTEQLHQLISEESRIKAIHLEEFWSKNHEPQKLFKVNRIGEIKEIEITGSHVGYVFTDRNIWAPHYDKDKRPSKNLVAAYWEYVENIKTAEQVIYIDYRDMGSGCFKYIDLINEPHFAFNESDLKEESERLKGIYAPKENHTACGYCGKQTPDDKVVTSTIIGRGRKEVWNSWKGRYENKSCTTHEQMKFCSGTCAGNEQMSREG